VMACGAGGSCRHDLPTSPPLPSKSIMHFSEPLPITAGQRPPNTMSIMHSSETR
jgi:hypothetical protein